MSQEKKVSIYSTVTCHFCHMAKEFFKANNIEFIDYNVGEDVEKRQEMIQKTGQLGVPVISIGDDIIIGFNEPKIRSLLGL